MKKKLWICNIRFMSWNKSKPWNNETRRWSSIRQPNHRDLRNSSRLSGMKTRRNSPPFKNQTQLVNCQPLRSLKKRSSGKSLENQMKRPIKGLLRWRISWRSRKWRIDGRRKQEKLMLKLQGKRMKNWKSKRLKFNYLRRNWRKKLAPSKEKRRW